MALAPRSMRAACKSIDLNDAEPEIVCELDGVELYLARWATKAELIDSVVSSLDASECERLDAARGSITVAGRRIGRGGGCVGESEFAFANEVDLIEGNVFVRDGELADAQAWFRDQRPTLPTKGKLTGAALEAPLGQLSVARLRDRAKRVGYRSLLRHADDYQETLLHYRGQVLQPLDDGALVLVTHRDGQWSDPVFVAWDGDDRLLEDDLVEFAGLGSGTYSYVTVLGDQREVPAIDAIDLVNHD